jgi:hypothetical protein
LALATLVRNLHFTYLQNRQPGVKGQILNLRRRLLLVRNMQGLGICAMIACVLAMLLVILGQESSALVLFVVALVLLALSMALSLAEIIISVTALEIQLSDMEET